MEDFEKELKQGFLDEAEQAITEVEQCFLILESSPEDKPTLDKIFRLAHNLKGSAKAVGFDDMGHFTHELETFMLKLKNDELKIKPTTVSLLLQCNDHLLRMVSDLRQDMNASIDSSHLIQMIQSHASGQDEENPVEENSNENSVEASSEGTLLSIVPPPDQFEDESAPTVEAVSSENDSEIEASTEPPPPPAEAFVEEESPAPVETSVSPVPQAAAPAQPPAGASAHLHPPASGGGGQTPNNKAPQATKNVDDNIRVSLSRVEKLLNFVGEMVILQAVLREQVAESNSLLLKKTVHQLGKVTKEVQDMSMSLRMVPVKPTFQKMQRIVRDTAQALGKTVHIKLMGEETELDKTVLERINDPLVHLIRNSVDHGIEAKEKRLSRGKNAAGEVVLSAYHQSGKLVIEVKDDGGGLDAEMLKQHAIKKGILRPTDMLSEKESFALIFKPGFSTKQQVTDISGRGVGMDVVRTNIEELGGEIQIESTLGSGTCFKIFLPLTLAIIDGMIVKTLGERYVIPLAMVHESLKPDPKDVKFTTGIGEVLMLRGENLPIYRLANLLGKKGTTKTEEMIAIVVRAGDRPFAVLVDDIIGQYQVVIKQLGAEVQNIPGISGSTILGDGRPALIIEPTDLIAKDKGIKTSEPRRLAV